MKYYIDCEFDGLGGKLISMALVREDGRSLYVVTDHKPQNLWVAEHVSPVLYAVPLDRIEFSAFEASPLALARLLEEYFGEDLNPHIVADWPDDIKYFCEACITGPGTMISVRSVSMEIRRVDAYENGKAIAGPDHAIQHNAWWDALALKTYFDQIESEDETMGHRPRGEFRDPPTDAKPVHPPHLKRNCEREGWDAYFAGKKRGECGYPLARPDLHEGYRKGWDAAAEADDRRP
jgi:hypothetical protein